MASTHDSRRPIRGLARRLVPLSLMALLPLGSAAWGEPAGLRCSGDALVSLLQVQPRPLFELRYASPYNFLGTTLYTDLNPQLRCPVALALQQVQRDLAAQGLGLKVWDAYRPLDVQQRMWDAIRDERYVSNPAVNAGRHTRGTAVDVTLIERSGQELPMPTGFDTFGETAHRNARGIDPERARNAQRLQEAMAHRGFLGLPTEWWHFDWHDWQRYPAVAQAPAPAPTAAPPDAWSNQLEQENEQQRKALEQLNEQYKREALERDRMESYRQGQENLRQQQNMRRYQTIEGKP